MPAWKLAPLDLANMPTDARYAKKFPIHRPTLSSRKAPFTNEARVTPPGPAASSPSKCKSFIAGWPRQLYVSTEKGTKPKPCGSTRAYAVRFSWSLCDAAAPAVVASWETMFRERGWMTEMSAMEMPCGRARRMSPLGLNGRAFGEGASAGSEAWESV
jgi:hypothetical protein